MCEKAEKERMAEELKTINENMQREEKTRYEQGINQLKGELVMKDQVIQKLNDELNQIKIHQLNVPIKHPPNNRPSHYNKKPANAVAQILQPV